MIVERVASDLAVAREDLGAYLRGEIDTTVGSAMAGLPETIRMHVESQVEGMLGPVDQPAASAAVEPHDHDLANPVVAEKVMHAIDETYDAAYEHPEPGPALPAQNERGQTAGLAQPRKLDSWNAEQTRFYNPKTPAERAAELEQRDKLEQINSLLKDEHLREALEELTDEP